MRALSEGCSGQEFLGRFTEEVRSILTKLYFDSRAGYHGFHKLLRVFSHGLPDNELS